MIKNPKVGDMVFYDWELWEIKEIKPIEEFCGTDRIDNLPVAVIVCLRNGYVELSGSHLSDFCFSINIKTSAISAFFREQYEILYHKDEKTNILSTPRIRAYMGGRWKQACLSSEHNIDYQVIFSEIRNFVNNVLEQLEKVENFRIYDVKIFK